MKDNEEKLPDSSEQKSQSANQSSKKPKMVGQVVEAGLEDYARQSLSALSQRDYDLGKFLFTVSTFAILISFTLITALGKEYSIVLISVFPFVMSIWVALNLVVEGAGEIKFSELIIDDYDRMKSYIRKQKNRWFFHFATGAVIFTILFSAISIYKWTGSSLLSWTGFKLADNQLVQPLNGIKNSLEKLNQTVEKAGRENVACNVKLDGLRNLIQNNHEKVVEAFLAHDNESKNLAERSSHHQD